MLNRNFLFIFLSILIGCGCYDCVLNLYPKETHTNVKDSSWESSENDSAIRNRPDTSSDTSVITDFDTSPAYINLGAADWVPYTRIVALGDHHADFSQAKRALQIGGVIDESLRWIGKNTIVVQTGDILDRGAEERELIDFYENLRTEAKKTGGQIINMLGNHEIMTALGDYRYMNPKACAAFSDLADLDLSNPAFSGLADEDCKRRAAAFWPGGPYAKIIATWPVVALKEKILFVHGGFHRNHANYGIDNLNNMTESWLNGKDSLQLAYVGGGNSVYAVDWDRTYSSSITLSDNICQELKNVLEQVGAEQMVVGHTVQPHINSVCNGTVIRIDIGMSEHYGGNIEVLEIINGFVKILVDPA